MTFKCVDCPKKTYHWKQNQQTNFGLIREVSLREGCTPTTELNAFEYIIRKYHEALPVVDLKLNSPHKLFVVESTDRALVLFNN